MSLYESRMSYSWALNTALVSLSQKSRSRIWNKKKLAAKTIGTWSDFYTEMMKALPLKRHDPNYKNQKLHEEAERSFLTQELDSIKGKLFKQCTVTPTKLDTECSECWRFNMNFNSRWIFSWKKNPSSIIKHKCITFASWNPRAIHQQRPGEQRGNYQYVFDLISCPSAGSY